MNDASHLVQLNIRILESIMLARASVVNNIHIRKFRQHKMSYETEMVTDEVMLNSVM